MENNIITKLIRMKKILDFLRWLEDYRIKLMERSCTGKF
jgi:hypothetical protein